jgi:hypothetical protein
MSNFLKHVYDPSDDDIRRMFPDYQPWTKQQWLDAYEGDGEAQRPADVAAFALRKLDQVTTSYRLNNAQRENLQRLARGEPTANNLRGFAGYCDTLRARQLGYVGW